jgi:hypothetical protein
MVAAQGGTRALFLNPESDQGYFSESVVAWGLYVCEDCGAQWTRAMIQADGKGDTLASATAWANLWRVLDPHEPFPSPEDAWAELDRRERELRWVKQEGRRWAAANELEELFAAPAATERNAVPPDDETVRRAREAVSVAQSWPSWRPSYSVQAGYHAALRKARRKPGASPKALAMTARSAAERAAQTTDP